MKRIIYILFLFALVLLSCTRYEFDDEGKIIGEGEVSVTFKVGEIEQIPFGDAFQTRSGNLKDLCTRINFAIFRQDEKIKNISKTSDSDGFGSFEVALTPGVYSVVAIAHSGLGNATISTPEKITFASNKCTDTFYFYDVITVNEKSTVSMSLKRAVAAFRMSITDNMPENVSKMQFYYTGGSSTFNAVTGRGCVNSKQTETFEVTSSMKGNPTQYQVYTFPHDDSGSLKMTVTAFDTSGEPFCEKVFESLPVTVNKISCWEGSFFQNTNEGRATNFSLTLDGDGEWGGTLDVLE